MIQALDRKLLRDLWGLRGQLLAIAAVVASGVATFVTMRSALDSLSRAMNEAYARQRFADVFARLERAPERVADDLARIQGVAALDTRVVAEVTLDVPGESAAITGRFVSLPDDDRPHLIEPHVVRGRLPEPGRDDEVALSDAFAEAHGFDPGDTLHAVVNERRMELRVVGEVLSPEYVYALAPGSIVPDDARFGVLWTRRRALAAAFDMEGAFNDVVLTLARGANEDAVLREVDELLDPNGGLGAVTRRDQGSHAYVANEIQQLRSMGGLLPTIFLGVATFLFSVVLTRTVSQQREVVALLKAFGRSNFEIGAHFGKLVAVVALLAAIAGVAAGAWMGGGMVDLYRDYFRFPRLEHVVAPRLVVLAFVVALAAAGVGAARAVRAAVTLPPAEAMRPPAPRSFRATWLERIGLFGGLSAQGRIVLRNLVRRPGRAVLSLVGTASGGALLMAGLVMSDSVDRVVDLQFRAAQREDVAVTLGAPRAEAALGDLARLPGVRRAEPARVVPARLVSGTRSRRVAIEAVHPGASLRPPIDADGLPRGVPRHGVVLTEKLAELLDVEPGDTLRVEALEGRRPESDVFVTGIYSSYVGLGARMDARALGDLMGEGPSLTGAYLLVDGARKAELDSALKDVPIAVGVGTRLETIERFEETSAESMGFMAFFLTLFAAVLVCGVVYNDARVTLAERGRELASMRVLGYRRTEISGILLGELWSLTALALPLALVLGYGLAWVSISGMDSELFQLPLIVTPSACAKTLVVVMSASLVAGLVVRRRLDHLDLIEVLKTRA